jgi:hypothetical protein
VVVNSTVGHPLAKRFALQQLHGDKRLALVLGNFVDGADVRVVERAGGARFALEAFQGLRIFPEFGGRNFSAMWRPSVVSSASYTSPIPPAPSLSITR